MNKPTLVIMAAGMGSRYGGLKQLDPVGPSGEIIMDYSVFDAIRAGFEKIVFVIRKDFADVFKSQIGSRILPYAQVEYAYQELSMLTESFEVNKERAKPWGTGHALLCAAQYFEGPFAILNADDYYGPIAYKTIYEYLCSGAQDAALVGYELQNTLSEHGSVARGVCQQNSSGYLVDVQEHLKIERSGAKILTYQDSTTTELTPNSLVSMNFWGFQSSVIKLFAAEFTKFLKENGKELKSEFFIPKVTDALIKQGALKVRVLPTTDKWFGVTYAEDKPSVVSKISQLIAQGVYPEKLFGTD